VNIVIDENVSYGLVHVLRQAGHVVTAIAELPTAGVDDDEVFRIAQEYRALLITRDYHFTNAVRFPAQETNGVIYIRRGNLTAEEEISLVQGFLAQHKLEEYTGKLVTLYTKSVAIR
jgi:predicted nuclease of predicted toxin-antitoxin system